MSAMLDPEESERLKQEGLARVEANSKRWLAEIRPFAVVLAKMQGTVTTDDLKAYAESLAKDGITPSHANAWGSIFRGKQFILTGLEIRSASVPAHRRRIQVWRLA